MKLRTVTDAAEALGLSRRKLKTGIQTGKYPCLHWHGRTLVDMDALAPIVEEEREQEARHEGMIGLRECAEAIGLSEDQLRRMAVEGLVPYQRSGRYYKFRLDAVEAAIRAGMKS